jgi:diguanylate cyclase (GGDEF)-like protein
MNYSRKTKEQLIGELNELRQRVHELEELEIQRNRAEEALRTLSIKDDLTGLYNRRGFFALAEQGLKTAQRMETEMLLIYGDLDDLKKINDTFGHKEGDQALMVISQILKESFRESDIIARIGGDEFVILAMNGFETSAEKLIDRFKQVLSDYRLQTNPSHKLAMSFGIACFDPKNPSSIDALLVEADKSMYKNKQKKRRQIRITGPDFLVPSNSNS